MRVKESLGEIPISPKTKILVSITEVGNKDKMDIRLNFLNYDGEWKPTKKGISIPVEQAKPLLEIINKGISNDYNIS